MIPIQWKQNDKKTMHVNEAENGVVYLTWPAIEKIEGIRHAFSTRIGGVSKEHLSSMNLSFSRGDDPANVRENYRRFCEAAGFEVALSLAASVVRQVDRRNVEMAPTQIVEMHK